MQKILLYFTSIDPIFKDYSRYLSGYDCYQYDLLFIVFGEKVTMSVDVSGDNLILIWTVTINGYTEVIDKDNADYVLGDQNKVIWSFICIILSSLLLLTTVINLGHSTGLNLS